MPTKEDLEQPIQTALKAITAIGEGLPNATSSGAARDNAESIEHLATAVRELVETRSRIGG